ncbi:hypothetical protein ACJIZ3_023208 [Penstemon smallii]|uniref:Pentatricopeptide repeat-containing protein n=1 Tax=Penstemon smallii TaxID=265156 RepID=A0ABD3TPD6_9LAMI
MTAAAVSLRRLLHPVSEPLTPIIPTITSFLQSVNLQNPDLSILNQFSSYLTPNLVTQIIKDQTSPFHSLFFFNWASNPNPNPNNYFHTHFCYIDKLLSHKLFALAADTLKTHEKFSDFMVGKFIKAHGDLGHLKSSVKLFHQVKERELGGCLFSYNALLGVLVRANRVSYAWGYFGHIVIKARVLKPDVSTYTTMIRGLCKVGMIENAEKLFVEMSCGRNLWTYNVTIDGFCKNGFVEKAQRIVDEMVKGETILPDVFSYTSLIDGYCKKGEFRNAMRCFNEMVTTRNCKPNVVTYNVLINGLCLSGDVDEAKRMMSLLRLTGVRDNIATHTSLLKGYCIVGKSEEAIEHFKEMINLGMSLDGKSYAVIVNELSKLGRPDEGVMLLKEMRASCISPSIAIFNAVLRSFVKLQKFDKAILLLKQMPQMGCYPNFLSYSAVITGLAGAKGMMHDVEMLVNEMIQNGHCLDTTLYSELIKAYCIHGDISNAIRLFTDMVDESLVISIACFEVFVKELSSRCLVLEVENLFEQMKNQCTVSDAETYQRTLDQYSSGNSDS